MDTYLIVHYRFYTFSLVHCQYSRTQWKNTRHK